jgi:hypothetical protein
LAIEKYCGKIRETNREWNEGLMTAYSLLSSWREKICTDSVMSITEK